MRWILLAAILAATLVPAFAQDTPPPAVQEEQCDCPDCDVAPVQTNYSYTLVITDEDVKRTREYNEGDLDEMTDEDIKELYLNEMVTGIKTFLFHFGASWRSGPDGSVIVQGSVGSRRRLDSQFEDLKFSFRTVDAQPSEATAVATEPDGLNPLEAAFLGLNGVEAKKLAIEQDVYLRITQVDDVHLPVTEELRSDRVNIVIRGGRIVRATRG